MKEGATIVGVSGPTMAANSENIPTITKKYRNYKFLSFGTLGAKLFAKGFPVIPLNGKVPIPLGWNKRPPTEAEVDQWAVAHPSANVGVLCGFGDIVGLDLDIYDVEIAESVQRFFGYLYDCPVRIGQAPKRLLLARCPGLDHKMFSAAYDHVVAPPAKGEKRNISRIEVLGPGQQFAVAGIHPDTSQQYMGLDYDQLSLDSLPVITKDDIYDLLEVFETKAEKAGWRRVADRPAGSHRPGQGVQEVVADDFAMVRSERRGTSIVDDFDLRGAKDFRQAMLELGWTFSGTGSFQIDHEGVPHEVKVWHCKHPLTDKAVSAAVYVDPRNRFLYLKNFSSSVDLDTEKPIRSSHALAVLMFEGDYRDGLKPWLRERGYSGEDDHRAEEDFENLVAMAEAAALEEINRLHDQGALTDEAGIGVIIDHRLNAPAANHVLEHLVKLDVGKKRPLSKLLRDRQEHIQRQEGEARVSEQAGDRAIMEWAETQKHESTLAAAQILASKVEDGELYLHGGVLVQVQSRPPRKMVGIDGSTATAPSIPVFLAHNHHSLVLLVDKHTAFVRTTEKKVIGVPVPGELPELLTNCPDLPVRSVQGLAYVPQVGPDGTYWGEEGFDPESELHFDFGGARFLPLLEGINTPTEAKARCVDHLVGSFLNGFTFADDVDKGVALAALLTALIRRQIGLAPGFLFRASMQGSGKTTLGRKIFIVVTGGDLAVMTLPRDHEEFRKAITSVLLESAPVIVFDNLPDGLEITHPGLARLITSTVHKDRLLGGNQQVELPARTTVILTGNNIVADSDNARRFLPCQLQPGCENPERRRFENADVYHNTLLNRPQIIQAALSLIKGYLGTLSAGDAVAVEASKAPPSGFPEWDRMVRFPLLWAMGVDVLEAIDRSKNTSADLLAKQTVLLGLYDIFPDQEFSATEVLSHALCFFDGAQLPGEDGGRGGRGSAISSAQLRDALYQVHGGFADNTRAVGWALRKMDGFTHAGLTMRSRVVHSANRYKVSRAEVDKGV